MSELERLAPITHAESHKAGRWFLAMLLATAGVVIAGLAAFNMWGRTGSKTRILDHASVTAPKSVTTVRLQLTGMECGMCAVHIQEVLGAVPGVVSVKANHETGVAEVMCDAADPGAMSHRIADAIAATNKYGIAEPGSSAPAAGANGEASDTHSDSNDGGSKPSS